MAPSLPNLPILTFFVFLSKIMPSQCEISGIQEIGVETVL